MELEKELELFKKKQKDLVIVKAVGKEELYQGEVEEHDLTNKRIVKFVPASGAATRMFEFLYQFLDDGVYTEPVKTFLDNIEKFPFFEKLDFQNKSDVEVVRIVLDTYGSVPKAWIDIHKYGNETVSAFEEHLYESKQVWKDKDVEYHFTISKNHEDGFIKRINDNPDYKISYSFQDSKTDTVSVTVDNQPFLLEDGSVLRRPGGHGALIHNLNQIDADLIVIRNIDNVCHRDLLDDTIKSRHKLVNIGLTVQKQIFQYIKQLESDDFEINEIEHLLKKTLKITLKKRLTKDIALSLLQRPLRVCGVVKNQGDVGGGPFLVDNGKYIDPQIVEIKEINMIRYQDIVNKASYFNPVDIVCFTKDLNDVSYDLLMFIETSRYFISEKSYKGTKLKALELPGLWNGAMHNWNTVFVEVSNTTFNPIKTVNDLL